MVNLMTKLFTAILDWLGSTKIIYQIGAGRGIERSRSGYYLGSAGAARPRGSEASSISTGINPRGPIDPNSPYLQTP
ncbi:MAG: hypothetical protein IMW89_06240 [Ktedonobacteraceae bacterium]|nr:hypothetical protein [Ktedonobacteraceae bacterium]